METPRSSPLAQVVTALRRMNQRHFAVDLVTKFAETSRTYEQYEEVAFLYNECKAYAESVHFLKQSLAATTDGQTLYTIRANLAKVLNHMNNPRESMIYSRANKSVMPTDLEIDLEIGFSHYLLGEYTKSKQIMENLLRVPELPIPLRDRCRYNLGTYKMEAGHFVEGLHDLVTVGHKMGLLPVQEVPELKKWSGLPEKGKTVVILAEGGLGDELIGMRYLGMLERLGMYPIWVTNQPHLKEVIERHGYRCETSLRDIQLPPDAEYCQAFFVPVLMGLDETQVWEGPYLTPRPDYVKKWKDILPEGPKIAIKWYGNVEYEQDLHRSIPTHYMDDYLTGTAKLISLQLEGVDGGWAFDAGSRIENVEDTLAIISLCDYTVSSCTSVAHMAGAMGKNSIICPPIVTYYCWLGRTDNKSHWYGDSVHVIRQTQHKEWKQVFEQVVKILDESDLCRIPDTELL